MSAEPIDGSRAEPCCDCGRLMPAGQWIAIPDWERGGFVAICEPCHDATLPQPVVARRQP